MKTWVHPDRGFFDSVKGVLYEANKPFDLPDDMPPPRGAVAFGSFAPPAAPVDSKPSMSEVSRGGKRMASDR